MPLKQKKDWTQGVKSEDLSAQYIYTYIFLGSVAKGIRTIAMLVFVTLCKGLPLDSECLCIDFGIRCWRKPFLWENSVGSG